jgi:hypothetical protein
VALGGGQSFNPFSAGILSDEYGLGSLNLKGNQAYEFGTGILATQDRDITGDIGEYFARAHQTGGNLGAIYGGKGGYGLTHGLEDLARLGEGEAVSQEGGLAQLIDTLYAGRAGSGFGRGLGALFAQNQYNPTQMGSPAYL